MGASNPNILVVGAGPWGRNLIRVFADLGVLAAVVDPDPAAREAAAALTEAPVAARREDLPLGTLSTLTAAAIATPAATHHRIALELLSQDLDLFVEKPLAVSLDAARELEREARRRQRILMVGHLLLYHPAVVALRALVAGGELGQLRYIYSNRLNLGRVRKEENILWSFAPHDLAVILHLLGESPISVDANGGSWLHNGVADVTVTHLDFAGGAKAHVFVSWLHPYKEQKLVVVGSEKMAVFDDCEPVEKLVLLDAGIDLPDGGDPSTRRGERRPIPFDRREPLALELEHFLDCCRERKTPLTDGRHALQVLEVLDRAQTALEGRSDQAVGE